jgi:hypothetical protein
MSLPDQKDAITKKFIEVANRHKAPIYTARRHAKFEGQIDHDSELWRDILDLLDEVLDYSFLVRVWRDPPYFEPPILNNGKWTFPSNKHDRVYPCETCYQTFLRSVDQYVCRQAGSLNRVVSRNKRLRNLTSLEKHFDC